MTQILSASPCVESILPLMKAECDVLITQGIHPFLKVVLVGDNPASLSYIKKKQDLCQKVGARSELIKLPTEVSPQDFIKVIDSINQDHHVHGCLIQLPVSPGLSHLDLANLIAPQKDVDGFHQKNVHSLFLNHNPKDYFVSCTPQGVLELLRFYKINPSGKKVTIIGRSAIVGKPLCLLLTNQNATVTLTHSKTTDIKEHTRNADIIIVAIGKAHFLDEHFLSENKEQIIIDVGMNRYEGKLVGDVNFEKVKPLVKAITPVPGGVGPMTVTCLIKNLIQSAKRGLP